MPSKSVSFCSCRLLLALRWPGRCDAQKPPRPASAATGPGRPDRGRAAAHHGGRGSRAGLRLAVREYQDRARDTALGRFSHRRRLTERAPEVKWVLPPALRKMARRSPRHCADPDQMGQAVLRSPKLKDIPDPLRGIAPAASWLCRAGGSPWFPPPSDSAATPTARCEPISSRARRRPARARCSGARWRWGAGRTPDQALQAALASVLHAHPLGP